MYSSSSNFNPFQCTENPSSIQDHSSHFLPFPPSSFLDDDEFLLSEFLSQPHHQQQQQQQQQQILASYTNLVAETPAEMNPAAASKKLAARSNNKKKRGNVNATTKQPVSRKRTGKKDRHSKIHTAQGPRDRRMRLSLQIARKFFDLQDMLGFDKASKTIDWLFTKSKAAIKELADSLPTRVKRSNSSGGGLSVSSTSESEVMSGVNKLTHGNEDIREMANEDYFVTNSCRQKKSKKLNEPAFNPLARESRDKARARARERTKEKQKIKSHLLDKSKHSLQENSSNNLDKNQDLGFGSQEMKCNLKIGSDQEEEEEEEEKEENGTSLLQNQMDSVAIVDNFLGLPSVPPKSSSIFDLSQNILIPSGDNFEDHHEFTGFPGNWEISSGRLVQNRYCAMPNIKVSSIGNVMNVQNPNAIFITTPPNSQEQNLTSVFMTTQAENPSSVFMNLSNSNKQNPNLIPINTTIDTALHFHHFTEDQFFCNHPKPGNNNRYGSLYIN